MRTKTKAPLTRATKTGNSSLTGKYKQYEIENLPSEATTVADASDQLPQWQDKSHRWEDQHSSMTAPYGEGKRKSGGSIKGKRLDPNLQSMEMRADNQNRLMGTVKGIVSNASMQQLGLGKGNASKER